jgi:hypothetical protein
VLVLRQHSNGKSAAPICKALFYTNGTSFECIRRRTCVDIDECQPTSPCLPGQTCINSPGSYACQCGAGYKNNIPGGCEKLFLVALVILQSAAAGLCPTDWYTVHIKASDSLGRPCFDIDECADAVAKNSTICGEFAICTNTLGSFTCACQENYVGDGKTCKRMLAGQEWIECALLLPFFR